MTEEADKSDAEKTWKNLSKEYLTTEQKLAIIREYNSDMNEERWQMSINALRDYLEKRKDD